MIAMVAKRGDRVEQILGEIFQAPAKGLALACGAGLIALTWYCIQRNDDGKKIRWPTIAVIAALVPICLVSLFFALYKPTAQKLSPQTGNAAKNADAAEMTDRGNAPPGTPKELCGKLLYLEENAGRYIGNFRGPKITNAGERAKYVSHSDGEEIDLYPATIKVFGDADRCFIDQAPDPALSHYRCYFSSKNPLQLALRVKAQLQRCFPNSVTEEKPAEKSFELKLNTSPQQLGPGYFELFYGGDGLTFSVFPTCAVPSYCTFFRAPGGGWRPLPGRPG